MLVRRIENDQPGTVRRQLNLHSNATIGRFEVVFRSDCTRPWIPVLWGRVCRKHKSQSLALGLRISKKEHIQSPELTMEERGRVTSGLVDKIGFDLSLHFRNG